MQKHRTKIPPRYYSYTYDGNVEWRVQDITGLGRKTIEYVYSDDILDKLTYVIYQKGQPDEFTHHYVYDADNRLSYVYTNAKGEGEKLQAHYLYYTHGPLKRVELAGNLQGIDYIYNINGWLKSINHPDLTTAHDPGGDGTGGAHSGFAADVFGMSLDYYSGDYSRSGSNITSAPGTEHYNGTISAMRWNNKKFGAGTGNQWEYQYNYNNLGWLTGATFGTLNSSGQFVGGTAYKEKINGYDENGNISGLTRYANQRMDELTYHYVPGLPNRLQYITDAEPQTAITSDIKNQGPDNYQYNEIGQLTESKSDKQRFTYDAYGHVTEIKNSNGQTIASYTYNDEGFRTRKVAAGTTTWYVRDGSGQIVATYLQEGSTITLNEVNLYGASRIGLALANTTGVVDKYVYEITDHLGNVRATLSRASEGIQYDATLNTGLAGDKTITASHSIALRAGFRTNGHKFSARIDANVTTDGIYTLLSASDYYPFGMEMPERIYRGSDAYRYGYQGQYAEKDESGYSHFEFREYDSRILRWISPDPKKVEHSLYIGMGNNPVNLVDPDGGSPWDWLKYQYYKIHPGYAVAGKAPRFFDFSSNWNAYWKLVPVEDKTFIGSFSLKVNFVNMALNITKGRVFDITRWLGDFSMRNQSLVDWLSSKENDLNRRKYNSINWKIQRVQINVKMPNNNLQVIADDGKSVSTMNYGALVNRERLASNPEGVWTGININLDPNDIGNSNVWGDEMNWENIQNGGTVKMVIVIHGLARKR